MIPETPVVLIVDDDRDRAELYASWLDEECVVRTAHDGPGALDALDDSVDVVVLVRPASGSGGDDVLSAVREQEIDARVAMVRASDADLAALTRAPDEVLSAPVSAETFRRTVSVLAAGRAYARGIRDLYALATEKAAVETGRAADAGDEARALDERIDRLRDRLDGTLDTLVDEAGFDAVYRAFADDSDLDPNEKRC